MLTRKQELDIIMTINSALAVGFIIAFSLLLSRVLHEKYMFLMFLMFLPFFLLTQYYFEGYSNRCNKRLINGETKKIIKSKRKMLKLQAKVNELEYKKKHNKELVAINTRINELKKQLKG